MCNQPAVAYPTTTIFPLFQSHGRAPRFFVCRRLCLDLTQIWRRSIIIHIHPSIVKSGHSQSVCSLLVDESCGEIVHLEQCAIGIYFYNNISQSQLMLFRLLLAQIANSSKWPNLLISHSNSNMPFCFFFCIFFLNKHLSQSTNNREYGGNNSKDGFCCCRT